MRQKIKFLVETQIETGNTPKKVLQNNPDLRRAVQLINRMDTGIQYRPEDLTWKELKLVEFVKNQMNKIRNKKMKQKQQEAKTGSNW